MLAGGGGRPGGGELPVGGGEQQGEMAELRVLLIAIVYPCCILGVNIASGRPGECAFLAVDPGVISMDARESAGWTVVVPPAAKHPSNPLMREDKVWEVRWDNTYPTTRWDEAKQKFRMWYGSSFSCDRAPKKTDSFPNPVDGCGHPTWHQQFPDKVPLQTKKGLSGIMYAESTDGIVWEKPALNLIPWGSTSTDSCTRIGRGQCITGRSYPKCLNGSLGGGDLARVNLTFPQAVAYCRQNARCQGFTAEIDKCSVDNSTIMKVHFKDGYGASRLTNTKGWSAWRDNAKGSSFGVVNGTNIVSMNTGGDGVVYDVHDVNESRRYKLLGGMDFHLCEKRPSSNVAVDGTTWPPCHLTYF